MTIALTTTRAFVLSGVLAHGGEVFPTELRALIKEKWGFTIPMVTIYKETGHLTNRGYLKRMEEFKTSQDRYKVTATNITLAKLECRAEFSDDLSERHYFSLLLMFKMAKMDAVIFKEQDRLLSQRSRPINCILDTLNLIRTDSRLEIIDHILNLD